MLGGGAEAAGRLRGHPPGATFGPPSRRSAQGWCGVREIELETCGRCRHEWKRRHAETRASCPDLIGNVPMVCFAQLAIGIACR